MPVPLVRHTGQCRPENQARLVRDGCLQNRRHVRDSINLHVFSRTGGPWAWIESGCFVRESNYSGHSAYNRDNLPYDFNIFVVAELYSTKKMLGVRMDYERAILQSTTGA